MSSQIKGEKEDIGEKIKVEEGRHNIILPNKYLAGVFKEGGGARVSLAHELHRQRQNNSRGRSE